MCGYLCVRLSECDVCRYACANSQIDAAEGVMCVFMRVLTAQIDAAEGVMFVRLC